MAAHGNIDVAAYLLSEAGIPDHMAKQYSSAPEPLLTTAAVAKWLGISTRAVCLWAECREIPAIKIGRQWRFRYEELSEWLASPKADKVKNYSNEKHASASA